MSSITYSYPNLVSVPLSSPPARSEWRNCAWIGLILLCAYFLLQNAYWAAGPDTAFYITIARNLALHRGFVFNRAAVGNIPPLWPLLLSSAMKISPQFRFINLIPMTCLIGASMMWYWVLRRMAEPRRAFQATLLSAFLYPWYSSSIQLRSEAFFCLVFTAALLVAYHISENHRGWWRIPLLLVLCIVMVNIRFAGLVGSAVVASILISGQRQIVLNRQWVAMVLALTLTAGSFMGIRYALKHVIPKAAAAGVIRPGAGDVGEDVNKEPGLVSVFDHAGPLRYVGRALFAGQWVGSALWMPLHIAVSSVPLAIAVNILGWWLLFLYYAYAWRLARSQQFILFGVAAYCAAIILRWPVVNPRYLVPVLPLVLTGIWQGCDHVRSILRKPAAITFFRLGTATFVFTLLFSNAALFAVDAYIARNPRFYHLYNAGEVEQLLAATNAVERLHVADGQVAVNGRIINLNRERPNGFSMRGLVMLTDRGIGLIPNKLDKSKPLAPKGKKAKPTTAKVTNKPASPSSAYSRGATRAAADMIGEGKPDNPATIKYAADHRIRYYAYKPPGSAWHAWHFNMTWLQERMHKKHSTHDRPAWELWEFKDGKAIQLPIPATDIPLPTRVPGL
jgi:hypothetical protein